VERDWLHVRSCYQHSRQARILRHTRTSPVGDPPSGKLLPSGTDQKPLFGDPVSALSVLDGRNPGEAVEKTASLRRFTDEPGSKTSRTQAGGASSSTRYPRLLSSRIILRARTFLASTLTAGPRSS
jgi:hypothetical protein